MAPSFKRAPILLAATEEAADKVSDIYGRCPLSSWVGSSRDRPSTKGYYPSVRVVLS